MNIKNRIVGFCDRVQAKRSQLTALAVVALLGVAPVASHATGGTGDGTILGQNYGLGIGGGLTAADWQGVAQGFNTSVSPLLVAIMPVFVVLLAVWMGPSVLKKLLKMAVHG